MAGSSTRMRWLVAAGVTTLLIGSGVATALVESSEGSGVSTQDEVTSTTGEPTTTTSEPTTTTSEPTTSTTGPPTPTADTDGESASRYWGPECGTGPPLNHGQYVAGAPQDGSSRRDAAHSDCGKPVSAIGSDGSLTSEPATDDSTEPSEPDDVEDHDPPTPSPEHGNSSSAPGHSKRGN